MPAGTNFPCRDAIGGKDARVTFRLHITDWSVIYDHMTAPKAPVQSSRASPRWRRRAEARPEEILEAALAEFTERGFDAARMEDIAKRAGISKGGGLPLFREQGRAARGADRSQDRARWPRRLQMIARAGAADPAGALKMLARGRCDAAERPTDRRRAAPGDRALGALSRNRGFYRTHVVERARARIGESDRGGNRQRRVPRCRSTRRRARLHRAALLRGDVDACPAG